METNRIAPAGPLPHEGTWFGRWGTLPYELLTPVPEPIEAAPARTLPVAA